MALDSRIPLAVQAPQIQNYTNALFDATRLRGAQQDVADQQRVSAERNALADVLRQGQVFDAQGQLTPGGLGQVAQAAPSQVPAYAQLANQQTRLNQQDQRQGVQLAMQRQDWARQGIAASLTPDDARSYVQSGLQFGVLDPQTAQQILGQIPSDPAAYGQWRTAMARQLMTPAQIAELDNGKWSAPQQSASGFFRAGPKGVEFYTDPKTGERILPVTVDPNAQGNVAQAKARGTAQGKAQVENEQGFGQAEATANQIIGVIDKAINHPGREYATGLSSVLPTLPGTDAADFGAVLDQIKGQAFLQAFESLKGGGQITEVEGQKATQAIARLERAQSEKEFLQSLQDLRGIVASGLERARRKAGGAAQANAAGGGAASSGAARPSLNDIFGN